jgi:hypothetical protein
LCSQSCRDDVSLDAIANEYLGPAFDAHQCPFQIMDRTNRTLCLHG